MSLSLCLSYRQRKLRLEKLRSSPGVTPPLGSKVDWGFTPVADSPCLGGCGLPMPALQLCWGIRDEQESPSPLPPPVIYKGWGAHPCSLGLGEIPSSTAKKAGNPWEPQQPSLPLPHKSLMGTTAARDGCHPQTRKFHFCYARVSLFE